MPRFPLLLLPPLLACLSSARAEEAVGSLPVTGSRVLAAEPAPEPYDPHGPMRAEPPPDPLGAALVGGLKVLGIGLGVMVILGVLVGLGGGLQTGC